MPRRLAAWLGAGVVLILAVAGGSTYWRGDKPVAPVVAPSPPATPAPVAAAVDISGKWVTDALPNAYDQNQKSTLHFTFEQSGDAVFGTVSEKTEFGGSIKGIQGGQIKGDTLVFYTQGVTTAGNGEQTYKENYRGVLQGAQIEFFRQNDVTTGGLPEKFTAKRE